MRQSKYIFLMLTLFVAVGSVYFLTAETNRTEANRHEFWITIDQNELAIVRKELPEFKFNVESVNDGIAVVNMSNGSLEQLSVKMHDQFHKCSGFTAHESKDEALNIAADNFSAKNTENVVEYSIDNQADVKQMLPATEEVKIRQTILDLSAIQTRRHDQPGGLTGANLIKDKWTQLAVGRGDIDVAFYQHPSTVSPQPSVILTIQGTEKPDEIVIVGGHQDSIVIGSQTGIAPGADDNASGIAVLTETIRILVEKNFRPARTVKFMAYAAEEVGLRGSADIAKAFKADNKNVIGVVQFDMTNFQGNPNVDFAFETDERFINTAQTQFMRNLVAEYLPNLVAGDLQCGYGCSDHASWRNQGYAASFPFEAPFQDHNKKIHTVDDTIALSSNMAVHAEKFAKLALTFVGELAKGDILPIVAKSKARFDFDGDGRTDVSIFRPNAGEWWYSRSSDNGYNAVQFGSSTDILTPADYTGDGKTDIAFRRESNGLFYILRSEDSLFYAFPFGAAGDISAPGDFDGDGKDDVTLFRPSTSTWFINRSSDGQTAFVTFGIAEDKPVVADYDGDGKADIAIYRPSVSQWWINRSRDGLAVYQFGASGDKTVQGDYTGDGKADLALWRESTGNWLILRSEDTLYYAFPFGAAGDIPTPGDYDGDGKMDAVVFRPSTSIWYKQQTKNGFDAVRFGFSTDFPVPGTYVAQ